MSYLGLKTWAHVWSAKSQLPCSQRMSLHGLTSSELGLRSWKPIRSGKSQLHTLNGWDCTDWPQGKWDLEAGKTEWSGKSQLQDLGPLHTRDWEPVTTTLQALSLVEKAGLSKFASHYPRGTNGACACKMDVQSTWIPTWHRTDHVSWSPGPFSKTTSWR